MYFVHENEVHSNFQVTMVQDCAYFTTNTFGLILKASKAQVKL